MPQVFVRESKETLDINEKIKQAILKQVREKPKKPWTVISRVSSDEWERREVRDTLRELTLNRVIIPTADGYLKENRL